MRALPLAIGGAALFAYAFTRRARDAAKPMTISSLDGSWTWPLPRWNGRSPVISDGFGSPRPGGVRHGGVDLMFARVATDSFKAGSPNGSKAFVMPDDAVAVAASDGLVWSATKTPRGWAVVIDHGPRKVATFYTHLEKLLVKETSGGKSGERVRVGQPIGVIGADPLDAQHLKHLHFEIWLAGPNSAVDPAPFMKQWTSIADPNALVARNAGFLYRPVGASGEAYPEWVRSLKGKAGVYLIRERRSGELVYIGSSAGRLYDTLTRHFQSWRRFKSYWRGQYSEGHDPGLTYERSSIEVAVRLTPPTKSFDEEMRLIARMKPRDNLIGQSIADDDVPF
ncbi:MAG: peptidoglycan DD-metalloendopeptidase family protein [Kofleriaceae bacterium]